MLVCSGIVQLIGEWTQLARESAVTSSNRIPWVSQAKLHASSNESLTHDRLCPNIIVRVRVEQNIFPNNLGNVLLHKPDRLWAHTRGAPRWFGIWGRVGFRFCSRGDGSDSHPCRFLGITFLQTVFYVRMTRQARFFLTIRQYKTYPKDTFFLKSLVSRTFWISSS